MTSLPEQLSAASTRQISAQLDAQFRFFSTFATQALENASRIVSLNLSASRDSLERSSHTARQLVQATQPRDLLVLRTHAEEQVRSLFNYGRELVNITANAQPYGLRTIAPAAQAAALAAPVVKEVAEKTEEVVQQTASAVAKAADTATEAVAQAAAPAVQAAAPVVQAAAPVVQAAAPVVEAAAPLAQPAAPEPLVVQQPEVTEALASVEDAAEPVAKQKQIARAAGKGAPKAAVAAQPLAAPVEAPEPASIARIETPSKRRK